MIIFILELVAMFCFSSFIWATFGFFQKKGKEGFGLMVIKVISPVAMLYILYAISITENAYTLNTFSALVLFILSSFIFWSCIFINKEKKLSLAYSQDLPEHIQQKGFYRIVRHPFYLSYLISYIAGFVATANPWLLVIVIGIFFLYYDAAKLEEEKFRKSTLAEEYEEYKRNTGMFFPKFVRKNYKVKEIL